MVLAVASTSLFARSAAFCIPFYLFLRCILGGPHVKASAKLEPIAVRTAHNCRNVSSGVSVIVISLPSASPPLKQSFILLGQMNIRRSRVRRKTPAEFCTYTEPPLPTLVGRNGASKGANSAVPCMYRGPPESCVYTGPPPLTLVGGNDASKGAKKSLLQ